MLLRYSFISSLVLAFGLEKNPLHDYFGRRPLADVGQGEDWRQDEMEGRQSGKVWIISLLSYLQ